MFATHKLDSRRGLAMLNPYPPVAFFFQIGITQGSCRDAKRVAPPEGRQFRVSTFFLEKSTN